MPSSTAARTVRIDSAPFVPFHVSPPLIPQQPNPTEENARSRIALTVLYFMTSPVASPTIRATRRGAQGFDRPPPLAYGCVVRLLEWGGRGHWQPQGARSWRDPCGFTTPAVFAEERTPDNAPSPRHPWRSPAVRTVRGDVPGDAPASGLGRQGVARVFDLDDG